MMSMHHALLTILGLMFATSGCDRAALYAVRPLRPAAPRGPVHVCVVVFKVRRADETPDRATFETASGVSLRANRFFLVSLQVELVFPQF